MFVVRWSTYFKQFSIEFSDRAGYASSATASVTKSDEISPLWQKIKCLWQFLRVYLVFGKNCYLLWQILYIIGQFFMVVNGQIMKIIKTIWSHWPRLLLSDRSGLILLKAEILRAKKNRQNSIPNNILIFIQKRRRISIRILSRFSISFKIRFEVKWGTHKAKQ